MSGPRNDQSGLTLVGLLVALGLLAILTGLAVPAWQRQIEHHRLTAGVTAVYGALVQLRRHSIFLNRPLVFIFRPEIAGQGWCFVMTDDPACDCHRGACPLTSGARRPIEAADFPLLDLRVLPRNGRIKFYPARGTTSAGSVELQVGLSTARIVVSSLGRIRVCSSSLAGYPECS